MEQYHAPFQLRISFRTGRGRQFLEWISGSLQIPLDRLIIPGLCHGFRLLTMLGQFLEVTHSGPADTDRTVGQQLLHTGNSRDHGMVENTCE